MLLLKIDNQNRIEIRKKVIFNLKHQMSPPPKFGNLFDYGNDDDWSLSSAVVFFERKVCFFFNNFITFGEKLSIQRKTNYQLFFTENKNY